MTRLTLPLALALAATAIVPETARADGLPVVNIDAGPTGVASGATRYVTLNGPRGTTLAAIATKSGRIERWRYLHQRLTVPAVAFDGTPSGLSADGRTLVLIRPRLGFPQSRTVLAILDARTLAPRRTVRLRGDFSFDAISPDGRRLFFIHYLSPTDPTRYEVRTFDAVAGRLAREPLVDPREPGEKMHGLPLSRATSADGRWAYTLYDAGTHAPFVHALDTIAGRARCIDVTLLAGRDLSPARLSVRGDHLMVRFGRRPEAVLNTRTFAVGRPAAAPVSAPDGGGVPWPWPAMAAALLAGAALALGVRRRRVVAT
jgi:hypothetical protein